MYHVTEHAIDRHIERFGGIKSRRTRENKKESLQIAAINGVPVLPKGDLKIRFLLNNKNKNIEYKLYEKMIVVIDGKRIVTVYKAYKADLVNWEHEVKK